MRNDPKKPGADLELARAEQAAIADAFREVFGLPGKRTASQVRVFEILAAHAGDGKDDYRFPDGRDGFAVALAAAHMDGAKSVLRAIDKQVQMSVKSPAPKKKRETLR